MTAQGLLPASARPGDSAGTRTGGAQADGGRGVQRPGGQEPAACLKGAARLHVFCALPRPPAAPLRPHGPGRPPAPLWPHCPRLPPSIPAAPGCPHCVAPLRPRGPRPPVTGPHAIRQMLFILVDADEPRNGRVFEYFRITEADIPSVQILNLSSDARYKMPFEDVTFQNLQKFGRSFLNRRAKVSGPGRRLPRTPALSPLFLILRASGQAKRGSTSRSSVGNAPHHPTSGLVHVSPAQTL